MSARLTVAEPGTVGLIAEILRGVPALPGAACIRKAGVFSDRRRIGEAKAICARCPVITACDRWASAERGLTGVVAGEIRGIVRADDGDDDETATEAL
ncbi:WhiB family transcriptional regulator [Mycobacterium sp. 4D054]|uniref:WhiB family transcriptional regulator n=1 Tax=Mycobacterium sp. 4D054 TaxID=3457440 RepID=UPI003FD27A47